MPATLTQIDLAARLGLSRATVSRALRGSPLLPASTRERVRRLADELGYRPDPVLAALSWRRHRSRRGRRDPAWALLHDGQLNLGEQARLSAAAEAQGFRLVPVRLATAEAGPVERQLAALGAVGVLVTPLRDTSLVRRFPWQELAWQQRSWLSVGLASWTAPLHAVRSDAVAGMALALEKMHARGLRRILIVRQDPRLSLLNELQGAGIALARSRLRGLRLLDLPLGKTEPLPSAGVDFRPQAVLTGFPALRHRLPAELAVLPWATLAVQGLRHPGAAGISYDLQLRAQAAADWLAQLVRRGEHGLPEQPCTLQIPARWVEGRSLAS